MRPLALVSLAIAVSIPAQGIPREPTGGTCVLAGGGRLPPEIPARFVELAGGDKAHIVLIPTASQSADDPKENDSLLRLWRDERGASAVEVLHTRDRARADDAAFVLPLRKATGVWIGGGTQKRLADAYLGTLVEKELMALLARGGVIGGTSAGTAIQTRTMIQEGMDPPIVATGFDFVPGAISDQHFLKRKRLPRLLKVLGEHPGLFGIGVDESTAAEIRGDSLRVIGASKAVLVLGAQNGHEAVTAECDPGEAIDLRAWRRAAAERATWSLANAFAPRLEQGTLLVGDAPGLVERFVTLAGERDAEIVVFDETKEGAERMRERLAAAGATRVHLFTAKSRGDAAHEHDRALASARGVVFGDSHLHESEELLADGSMPRASAVAAVLARGGVVWGNGVLGEVVAAAATNAAPSPPIGYRRGIGLLPGTMIVVRRLQPTKPGDPPVGPITDGAPHEWVHRCANRMPHLTGIHVESAALVQGSTLEVLGELPTHVLPTSPGGKPGDDRAKVTLEPGAKWDLVAQKKL